MNRAATSVLMLALLPVVVGCGPATKRPESIAASSYAGVPSGVPAASIGPGATSAVWTDGRLELTVYGSGSCPAVPVALSAPDADTVEITVSADYGVVACTADMSPTTWILEPPDAVDDAGTLTVKVYGYGASPVVLQVRRS